MAGYITCSTKGLVKLRWSTLANRIILWRLRDRIIPPVGWKCVVCVP